MSIWSAFDGLELQTLATDGETDAANRLNVWPVSADEIGEDDAFSSHAIYGHLKVGGVRCLADCTTTEDARAIAAAIATATGLPIVYDLLIEWPVTP
jgi:hypothetical protein